MTFWLYLFVVAFTVSLFFHWLVIHTVLSLPV